MILSEKEAADILKLVDPADYPQLGILLPFIDDYLKTATGRDWSSDNPIDPTAKMAASALAVRWFDNPGQMGEEIKFTDPVAGLITQLHSKALGMVT